MRATVLRNIALLGLIQLFAPRLVLPQLLPGLVETQKILGKQIQIKDAKPSDPTKRKLIGKGKEVNSLDTLVGDPTVAGATLSFFANGTISSRQTFALPSTLWSAAGTTGFKYRDPTGSVGPTKVVLIKKTGGGTFKIKAIVQAKHGPVTVVPPDQGIDACMLLKINNGDSYDVRLGSGGVIKKNNASTFLIKDETTEGRCRCTEVPANGITNGDFECGDFTGWTASGSGAVPGGAFLAEQGTCWSAFETRGITLSGDFTAVTRSLGSGSQTLTSVGILTSDPFTASNSVVFDALSEKQDGGSSNPVTFDVDLLTEDGSAILATQAVQTAILSLAFPCGASAAQRDGMFSHHQLDTSAFAGQRVRVQFRQHTNVVNLAFFTLVDNVAAQ